jgi:release factor glutamine methyltransferase
MTGVIDRPRTDGTALPFMFDRFELALEWGQRTLQASHTASLDAQLLLAHVLGKSRSHVLANSNSRLESDQFRRYSALVKRRQSGEPVAYLRGYIDWLDLRLEVNWHTLIPRPDSEILFECAAVAAGRAGAIRLVDVGTGSGALAIALARRLPDAHLIAVDTSTGALEVAARNARTWGVDRQIEFLAGDLLTAVAHEPDLIVANLPYLSDEMMATRGVDVRHEPEDALHGGPTGLELYARLLHQLADRSWKPEVLLEIDPRQRDEMLLLFRETLPDACIRTALDLAGHTRVAHAWFGAT